MKKRLLKTFKEVYDYLRIKPELHQQITNLVNSPHSDDVVFGNIAQIVGTRKAKVIMDFANAAGGLYI